MEKEKITYKELNIFMAGSQNYLNAYPKEDLTVAALKRVRRKNKLKHEDFNEKCEIERIKLASKDDTSAKNIIRINGVLQYDEANTLALEAKLKEMMSKSVDAYTYILKEEDLPKDLAYVWREIFEKFIIAPVVYEDDKVVEETSLTKE